MIELDKGVDAMKIIHCADLHLDSTMESNLSSAQAKQRREEIYETFAKIVDYARDNGVKVIIIAGDMFDTKNSQIRIRNRVRDLISAAADIDFLYLKGNHDSADIFTEAPANLRTFNDGITRYSYGNVDIYGSESSSAVYTDLAPERDRLNIVILHGQTVSGNTVGEGLINIPALANRNIDYLALGHIHSYKCGRIDERGIYCYSGCLEGRGFDECGDKGFVLLDAERGGITHTFVPFARRRLHDVTVALEGAMTNNDITSSIDKAVADIPADDMVKIVLTGEIDEETDIDTVYISRLYSERFKFVKAYNKTSLLIDYEAYRNDISLKGEFIRLVSEENLDDAEKRQIILTGLRALAGREIDI